MSWNPRPFEGWGDTLRSDYHAGYSDGYHQARFGASHDDTRDQNAYRQGFNDGQSDVMAALARIATEMKEFAKEHPVQIVSNGRIHGN